VLQGEEIAAQDHDEAHRNQPRSAREGGHGQQKHGRAQAQRGFALRRLAEELLSQDHVQQVQLDLAGWKIPFERGRHAAARPGGQVGHDDGLAVEPLG
jgi:hypothetical protein